MVSRAVERKIKRELKTVRSMITIYCRGNHGLYKTFCRDTLCW
jgi:hypothetical protein